MGIPKTNRWLLAAVLSAAVVPCASLIFHGHWVEAGQLTASRAALSDVLIDAPGAPSGLIADYGSVMDGLRAERSVTAASPVLTGPILLFKGDRRATARALALPANQRRGQALASLVVAGDVRDLAGEEPAVLLAEGLAADLGATVGDEVQLLSLALGPEALGARRRTVRVVAVLRSGLEGFDRTAAVLRLSTARQVLAPGRGLSGVESFVVPVGVADDPRRLSEAGGREGLRARLRTERDWPERDAAAIHSLGRAGLLTALLVALLGFTLILPFDRKRGIRLYLRRGLPVPAAVVVISVGAAAGLAVLDLGAPHGLPAGAVGDTGRLLLAVAVALLLAPALVGRVRGTAAGAAVAAVVAIAGVHPAASTVLAELGADVARDGTRATTTAGALVEVGPVDAMITRGAEVATAKVAGIDPSRAESAKLLRALTGAAAAAPLRPAKAPRPRPWTGDGDLGVLLDELVELGGRLPQEGPPDDADPQRADGDVPGIVLGSVLARRLGVEPGDRVSVAAAPAVLDGAGRIDPPPPREFTVAALASLGLRSVDDRLAIADAWQVEALGGRGTDGQERALVGDFSAGQGATPFVARARRAGVAGALQIFLVCLLLGAASSKRRTAARATLVLMAWAALGALVGGMMGVTDAARGMVGLGDSALYDVVPRGRAGLFDALSAWSMLPAVAGLTAAVLGVSFRRLLLSKMTVGEEES